MLDPVTFDQLRILSTVVEHGSFSAAARKLLRVQSAVSQSIRALEVQLNVELFDRSSRLPRLTDAGRAIHLEAVRILRAVDQLKARAVSCREGLEPEISIAVDQMLPTQFLMRSISSLAEAYPGLPVTLFTEALPGACEKWLQEGVVNFAIHSPFSEINERANTEFLVSIPIIPVVSVEHPLAALPGSISNAELGKHLQLVLTDRSQVINSVAEGTASSTRVWRFADQHTRLEFLLNGFGWSHLPLHMADQYIKAGRIKFLDLQHYGGGHVTLPLHLVFPISNPPGVAAQFLIRDLKERLATMPSVSSIVGRDVPEVRAVVRRNATAETRA